MYSIAKEVRYIVRRKGLLFTAYVENKMAYIATFLKSVEIII